MAKTTGFRKVRSGGVDQGDVTLNRFGMIPIIQKSVGVSAGSFADPLPAGGGQQRIGVVPDDGADILEILTMVDIAVGGSAATMTIDFGMSADTSAFGVIVVSGIGRYTLPTKDFVVVTAAGVSGIPTGHPLTVHVSGSRYTTSAGQHILATIASASGGSITVPGFICYTTFLQPLGDS